MRIEKASPTIQENYLIEQKQTGNVTSSNLALFAFATAFLPRVIGALGAPSTINFLHFITIPWVCGFVLAKSRIRDRLQFIISQELLLGLALLLGVITASALLNNAGIINIVLSFLLLAEPFMWLLTVVSLPFSPSSLERFRRWWMRFGFMNLLFALIQSFVLHLDQINADHIKGVFLGQGSGHVVGGSISLAFVVYYFSSAKNQPIWIRGMIIAASLIHLVKADAKQVLAVFLAALVVLILIKVQDLGKFIQYMGIATVFVGLITLAAQTVFKALLVWFDWDIQRQGMELKLSGFSILPNFYHSPLNWLLGLGPGHTISRLGGWMVWDYQDLLQPFDITVSNASKAVWRVVANNWLGDRSSWFSPLFGWAGIWGDLGLLGLAAYIYLWILVWKRLCYDDLSKFFALTVLLFGTILTQIEEPGYMLFMTGIIAIRWQEHRNQQALDRF
jgi:hypothetical protein